MIKKQKETSLNNISMARARILFDLKNGFRSSNVVFGSITNQEEAEEYYAFSKNSIEK